MNQTNWQQLTNMRKSKFIPNQELRDKIRLLKRLQIAARNNKEKELERSEQREFLLNLKETHQTILEQINQRLEALK